MATQNISPKFTILIRPVERLVLELRLLRLFASPSLDLSRIGPPQLARRRKPPQKKAMRKLK
jgi:hypothetical protein